MRPEFEQPEENQLGVDFDNYREAIRFAQVLGIMILNGPRKAFRNAPLIIHGQLIDQLAEITSLDEPISFRLKVPEAGNTPLPYNTNSVLSEAMKRATDKQNR